MLCLFMAIIIMRLVFMGHFVSQEKLNNKIGGYLFIFQEVSKCYSWYMFCFKIHTYAHKYKHFKDYF